MSYKTPIIRNTTITTNKSVQGDPIEIKIERMLAGKEPIKNGTPPIYTERKEGVRASTNIRTDRFLIAVEGGDKIAKSYKARREERQKTKEDSGKTDTTGAEAKSA